jgi:hypothetical protein
VSALRGSSQRRGDDVMKKIIQIMPACDGWEALFFSYDDGELFCDPILLGGGPLVSERPYVGRKVPSEPLQRGTI